MEKAEKAKQNFLSGMNCAQSVLCAFEDECGLAHETALKLASGFGGGMARMREVCGAVSGMFMVLGLLYGYDDPKADTEKKQLYTDVQALAEEFRKDAGSILCREILKNPPSDPNPSPRTAAYYAMRPCERMVYNAADLMDAFIASHPLEEN